MTLATTKLTLSPALRWLLLVPAALAAWWATLLVGMLVYDWVEALCPPAQVVSGFCTNPRVNAALDALMIVFAGLSAIAVEAAVVRTAPARKAACCWLAFAAGSAVAVLGFGQGIMMASVLAPVLSAVTCGFVYALVITARLRKPPAAA